MYGSTDITKVADLMFSHITAPARIAPSTTTGHTKETSIPTQANEDTALRLSEQN